MAKNITYRYSSENGRVYQLDTNNSYVDVTDSISQAELDIIKKNSAGKGGSLDQISHQEVERQLNEHRDAVAKKEADIAAARQKEIDRVTAARKAAEEERNNKEFMTTSDNNVGESCAICKENALQCVCEVILKVNEKPQQEYYWYSRKEGRKKIPTVMTSMGNSEIKYSIIGACKFNNSSDGKHCTHLYYYKDQVNIASSQILWKTDKSGILSLPYDKKIADMRLHAIQINANGNHKVVAEKTKISEEEDETTITSIDRFVRALSLLISSDSSLKIPSTIYRIGVTECGGEKDKIDTSSLDLVEFYAEDRQTTLAILPEYFVGGNFEVSLEFNIIKKNSSDKTFEPKISVVFLEKVEKDEKKFDISFGKEILNTGLLGVLGGISDFLTDGNMTVLGATAPFSVSAFSKIALNEVGAELDYREDGVYVKRKGEIVLDPLLGMKIIIDLIDVVVSIIAPGYVVTKRLVSTTLESASEIGKRFSTGGVTKNFGDIAKDSFTGGGREIRQVQNVLSAAGSEYDAKDNAMTIVADLEIQGGFNAKWSFFNNKLGEWPVNFNYASVSLGVILTLGAAAKVKAWIFEAEAKLFIRAIFIAHVGFVKKEDRSYMALWHDKLRVEWGLSAKATAGDWVSVGYEDTGTLKVLDETTDENPSVILKEWITETKNS